MIAKCALSLEDISILNLEDKNNEDSIVVCIKKRKYGCKDFKHRVKILVGVLEDQVDVQKVAGGEKEVLQQQVWGRSWVVRNKCCVLRRRRRKMINTLHFGTISLSTGKTPRVVIQSCWRQEMCWRAYK